MHQVNPWPGQTVFPYTNPHHLTGNILKIVIRKSSLVYPGAFLKNFLVRVHNLLINLEFSFKEWDEPTPLSVGKLWKLWRRWKVKR